MIASSLGWDFQVSKIIRVKHAWSLIPYGSFSESIFASKGSRGLVNDLDLISGRVAENYKFYESFLSIKFSNGKYLSVFPGPNRVDWKISDNEWIFDGDISNDNLILEFSSEERINWRWKSVLDDFMGKQVAVSPSDQLLFIFYRGGVEFVISVVEELDSPFKQILFISES